MGARFLMTAAAVGACLVVVAEASAKLPDTPKLGLVSDDGNSSIDFSLTAQLRVELEHADKGVGKDAEERATIFFRRIRPIAKGTLFTKDLSYQLHVNLVPGAIELMDLYVGYAFHPQAQLLIGQAKVPFTRYRLNSFKDTPVTEWSNETKFFGAERQLGLMLHNGVGKPPEIEYQLGVYTGVNARGSNAVGMARAFGETPLNPSDLTDPAPPAELHPEVVAHLGYNHGGMNPRRPSDLEGGPPRFMVGASAAWDARPAAQQDMSLRLAPEALFKAYGFSLNGVAYAGFWEQEEGALDSTALGFTGVMVQTSQVFLEQLEVAFRYTLVHLTSRLRESASAYGASQVAAATDPAEADTLRQQYRSVGRVTDEHELTVGFNVYLYGTALKWGTDASSLLHARTDGDRVDRRIRTQLQLAF